MEGYSVKIIESSKELRAKERIAVKDFSNAVQIDDATKSGGLVIDIDFYVVCGVHNEKSDNKDYTKFVIVDKAGNKFVTGSESLFTSLREIMVEMAEEEEEYQTEIYRKDSKNYKGKQFLTCSIV